MKTMALLYMLACMPMAFAASSSAADIFSSANSKAGQALVEKNCISCHAASFGGDGSAIYTHELHKIKTAKGLVAQVRNCNTMLGLKWFEDEELNAAAYLNQQYYHFTK